MNVIINDSTREKASYEGRGEGTKFLPTSHFYSPLTATKAGRLAKPARRQRRWIGPVQERPREEMLEGYCGTANEMCARVVAFLWCSDVYCMSIICTTNPPPSMYS